MMDWTRATLRFGDPIHRSVAESGGERETPLVRAAAVLRVRAMRGRGHTSIPFRAAHSTIHRSVHLVQSSIPPFNGPFIWPNRPFQHSPRGLRAGPPPPPSLTAGSSLSSPTSDRVLRVCTGYSMNKQSHHRRLTVHTECVPGTL